MLRLEPSRHVADMDPASQIGVSVESAMRWLHPDAGDMWKMTMSLSDVVRACADPSKRLPRQACFLVTIRPTAAS